MSPPDLEHRNHRAATVLFAAVCSMVMLGGGCSSGASSGAGSQGRAGGAPDELARSFESVPVPRPQTVAMIGDSITVSSRDALTERLGALDLDVIALDAQEGRRMTVGVRGSVNPGSDVVAYVQVASPPDLWVLALGTNDIGQYRDVDDVRDQVRAVLSPIPDGVPVVWIDTWYRDRLAETVMVNEAIRSVVDARPNSVVVDWFTASRDDGVITGDGVHLTSTVGVDRFADVVATAVGDLLP